MCGVEFFVIITEHIMGTGKFQSSNRRNASRLIHVIGLAILAVWVAPFTLPLSTAAFARDRDDDHGGGKHFEQPRMAAPVMPAPKPPAVQVQQPQREMRQDDDDHGGGGKNQQNSSGQSGTQGGGWSKSDDRQPAATSQSKPTEINQSAKFTPDVTSGGQEQSDRSGGSSTGGSNSLGAGASGSGHSGGDGGGSNTGRNWQSSKDNPAPKSQRGDNSSGNGSGDDKNSEDSKTAGRNDSNDDKTQSAQPAQQQEDRSFGASTSLLDFFRRNTGSAPAPAAAALAPIVPAVAAPVADRDRSDDKQPSKQDVKPAKAAAALDKAGKSKTAGKIVQAPPRAPPPIEIPFADLTTFKPREIVASNLSPAQLQRAKSLGFAVPAQTLIGNLGLPSVQRLVVPAGMSEVNAYALLKHEVPSATLSANHVYRISPAADASERPAAAADAAAVAPGTSAVPCSGEKCFGTALIGWTPEHRTCARRVRIGIIDTSFDLTHPAFASHKFSNGNFLGDGTTSARDWHGTAVLGLLAGDSRGGTPGLVPDADFYLASAFRTDAEGNASADTIGVLNALSWLEALDVKLINMSFSGPHDELIEKAINVMSANGVIFVAAAGNRGPNAPPSFPAAYVNVIAVTAVGRSMQGYRHANRGDYVDAAAPGVEVWTALPNSKEGFRTGTSFAAPFFTGIVATLPAMQSGKMRKADVLDQLAFKDLGVPGRDPVYGKGLAQVPEHCSNPALIARGQGAPQQATQPKMSVGAPAAAVSPAAVSPASAPGTTPAVKRGTAEAASGPSAR